MKYAMNTYNLTREQATRALIVKAEMVNIKKTGVDDLAALHELICRLQISNITICDNVKRKIMDTKPPSSKVSGASTSKRSKKSSAKANSLKISPGLKRNNITRASTALAKKPRH